MKKIIPLIITIIPGFAFAATTIGNILTDITKSVFKPLISLFMVIATVVFLWGIVGYIRSAGEEDVSEAKRFIIYGLIGLFVMVSVWGLVGIISGTIFGTGSSSPTTSGSLPASYFDNVQN